MKIKRSQLKQIIKEEVERVLLEQDPRTQTRYPPVPQVEDPSRIRLQQRDAEGVLRPASYFYEPFQPPPGLEAADPDARQVVSPLRGVGQGRVGMSSPEMRDWYNTLQQRGYDLETRTWPEERTPEAIAARESDRDFQRQWREADIAGDRETLAAMEAELVAQNPSMRPRITGRRRASAEDIARLGGAGGHDVLPGIVMLGDDPPTGPAVAAAPSAAPQPVIDLGTDIVVGRPSAAEQPSTELATLYEIIENEIGDLIK